MSGVLSRISKAAIRRLPFTLGSSCCATMARRLKEEIEQELAVFRLRHQMEDAIQRLVGVVGVQGGEAEVARFGKLDGQFHGFLGTGSHRSG